MPSLYIIADPNGAGKTTFIKRFAPRHLALLDFINADELARGLSPLAPERAQIGQAHRPLVEDGGDHEHAVVGGLHRDRLRELGGLELVQEEVRLAVHVIRRRPLRRVPELSLIHI